MCTLAWGKTENGLWACFNRDEQRTRARAESPGVHADTGLPVVFARDPEGGGTWFAASSAGFAVALLNHYPKGFRNPGQVSYKSRGGLVLRLAHTKSSTEAAAVLEGTDLTSYPPFCLFVLSTGGSKAWIWQGDRLEDLDYGSPFWTTSSYQPVQVTQWRSGWWNRNTEGKDPGLAEAGRLMRLTCPENPAHGITMDRPDARTLSQIELSLDPGELRFSYRERDPDGVAFLPPADVQLLA